MPMTAENILPLEIPKPERQPDSDWVKSRYANVYKYAPSGMYFVHAKVRGHLVRRSLKTKSIEIAKDRAAEILEGERQRLARKPEDGVTFANLAEEFLNGIRSDTDMKPNAKRYRETTLAAIKATWPALWDSALDSHKPEAFATWAKALRDSYSPTRYNGTLETIRAIMRLAVKRGVFASDPTADIERAPVKLKPPKLPDAAKFQELLNRLDAEPSRHHAARFVRFLAFCGARPAAARLVEPKHVDLKNNRLELPPVKYNEKPVSLPIFDDMRPVLERLLADHPGEGPLLAIANPQRALKSACREVGIPLLNLKALRHWFTTRCLQARVDVPTVAHWRGDKDGGAMLLRVYSHLLDEHSQAMAKRVKLS
jgi:integrase